jgi:hypothetical protein
MPGSAQLGDSHLLLLHQSSYHSMPYIVDNDTVITVHSEMHAVPAVLNTYVPRKAMP